MKQEYARAVRMGTALSQLKTVTRLPISEVNGQTASMC